MITPMPTHTTGDQAPISQTGIAALILDDNQFDRLKIRRLFQSTGMTVYLDEADSLQTLHDMLDAQEFDVILLDYDLPRNSGMDAVKLVRSHPRNHSAATIMVTGFDQSDIAVQALKLGCTDYISKGELSAARLRTSVLAAIDEAAHLHASTRAHEQFSECLAERIMSEYSSVLQPELAKIVREMRALKATLGDPSSNLPHDLEQIEKRCIRLWSILTNRQELGIQPIPVKTIQ